VSNVWERRDRSESEKFPLTNGDEIKISEFYVKIEEQNIEQYSP
jgi:hypothetical protein